MSNYKQLGKNTLLVFIGNMGSKLIALLMLPFYTSWLSVDEFGTADNVMIYSTLLFGIFTLSISESIFIFPKGQGVLDQKKYFSSGLFFTSFILFIGGGMLYILYTLFNYYEILESFTNNAFLIFLLICSLFIQTYTQQFTRSINEIKIYAISGVILTISTAVLSVIFIPIFKLNGFFIAQISALTISGIFTFLSSKSYRFLDYRTIDKKRFSQMLKYSIPLIPNAIIWWIVASLNRPILEEYLGMHSVGIFAVANKLPSLLNVFFSIFLVSWQISIIEEYKKPDYAKFYNKILKIIFSLLSMLVLFFTFFGEMLNSIIADKKFGDAWVYIPLLAMAALFASISGFIGANFSAIRKSKYYFYSSIWGALTAVILNFTLIPVYGLYGAVLAVLCSHLVMTLSRIYYTLSMVRISNIGYYLQILVILVVAIIFKNNTINSFFSL